MLGALASSTTSSAKERLCLGHWRALQLLRQKRDCAWGTGELYNFVGKRELLIESCGELYNFFGKREIVLGALASSTTLQLRRQKRDCAWGTGELYNFVGKRQLLIESCGELYNFFGKREIVLGALASSTTSSAKERLCLGHWRALQLLRQKRTSD